MTKQHGGARKGAGRRYLNGSDPHEGTPAVTVTISIPRAMRDTLRDLGNGNVSKGTRKLVKEATMENRYVWEGPGFYASRGKGRNATVTLMVYLDYQGYACGELDHNDINQAARQQGLGTAFWHDTEAELREALN